MAKINDMVIQKYKPEEDIISCVAKNWPYNPDMDFPEEKMAKFERGSLPPNDLLLKPGCILMLLRNWSLANGNLQFSFHL